MFTTSLDLCTSYSSCYSCDFE